MEECMTQNNDLVSGSHVDRRALSPAGGQGDGQKLGLDEGRAAGDAQPSGLADDEPPGGECGGGPHADGR